MVHSNAVVLALVAGIALAASAISARRMLGAPEVAAGTRMGPHHRWIRYAMLWGASLLAVLVPAAAVLVVLRRRGRPRA